MAQPNALLRAMLVAEDVTMVMNSITKDKCFVVQHFSYNSQRERVASRMMTSMEDSSYIDFVIRIASANAGKTFYQHMTQNEPFAYSFLFNASFNGSGRLTDYDDAMMVKGFIVDMEEEICSSSQDNLPDMQVLIKVKLLLTSITYIGNEQNLKLTI